MKRMLLLLSCLLLLAFCGCGAQESTAPTPFASVSTPPSPEPTPAPTPEPTPTPTPMPTVWTVTAESAEEILALAQIPSLQVIDATQSREYEALLQLHEKLPDCEVRWEYEFQGVRYPSDTTQLTVTDMTGLEEALRYLPALEEVDLLEARPSIEDLDRFSAIRPDVFWLCVLNFHGFRVRTDIPVYSSLQPVGYVPYGDAFYYPILKYCTRLKALDLGHNTLTDASLELIGKMTDLQVLILADDRITDASPLANLHELIFLELFMNYNLEDFSFLNELTKLKDLNLCYCRNLDSLDFLDKMPELEFLMVKYTGLDPELFEYWQEERPEVRMVLYGDRESTGEGWRATGRNRMIRIAFSNWPSVVRYERYNDMDFQFGNKLYPITYYVKE